MNEPFVYVATYSVKPGMIEDARRRITALGDLVESEEPELVAFHLYLDEENARVTNVQVHPDSDSMATHMRVVARHLADAGDWLGETLVQQVLGTPPPELVRYAEEYGEPLDIFETRLTGFTRSGAGQPAGRGH
jgi:hypothetical protein